MTAFTEQWRPVVGFGDAIASAYSISNKGQVKSNRSGRMLRPIRNSLGYLSVSLWTGGVGKRVFVHVLVLTAFNGPRPDGMVCCHFDGDPANNKLGNLRWDTQSANLRDATRHGTHPRGSRTHCPRNHPLTGPNLARRTRDRSRLCLACSRARSLRSSRRYTGKPVPDMATTADECYRRIMGIIEVGS